MIDLHCHILPGIDDGVSDIGEAVEMARIAAADGISKIVASPHIGGQTLTWKTENGHLSEIIDEKIGHLKRNLSAEGIPVEIIRGGEVSAFLPPQTCELFTINGTAYLIVEFPHTHLPVNSRDGIFAMVVYGLRPIIAHPERNASIIQNPEKLRELVQSGALVQITAASLTGEFGLESQACALYLLQQQMVSFIASDGHGAAHRPPVLSRAFQAAKKHVGHKKAHALISENPEAVIKGMSLSKC